jgi:hypothetical protein
VKAFSMVAKISSALAIREEREAVDVAHLEVHPWIDGL